MIVHLDHNLDLMDSKKYIIFLYSIVISCNYSTSDYNKSINYYVESTYMAL